MFQSGIYINKMSGLPPFNQLDNKVYCDRQQTRHIASHPSDSYCMEPIVAEMSTEAYCVQRFINCHSFIRHSMPRIHLAQIVAEMSTEAYCVHRFINCNSFIRHSIPRIHLAHSLMNHSIFILRGIAFNPSTKESTLG